VVQTGNGGTGPFESVLAADGLEAAGAAEKSVPTARRRRLPRSLLRDVPTALSTSVVLIIVLAAAVAPVVAPYGPNTPDYANTLAGPSARHFFGTDELGRDVFSRIVFGARTSLLIGFAAVAFSVALGSVVGSISGYFGGWIDSLFMRAVDLILAFPLLILAILIVVVLGPSFATVVVAIGVSQFPVFARLARSLALAQRSREYVECARAIGTSDWKILLQHIWPNQMRPIAVQALSTIGVAILSGAALSFLGIGVQPPTADWGRMVSEYAALIFTHPSLAFYPGLAIGVTVLAWNLAGDGLLAALDAGGTRGVL
jgi:peptide/nickel transport system permease protein